MARDLGAHPSIRFWKSADFFNKTTEANREVPQEAGVRTAREVEVEAQSGEPNGQEPPTSDQPKLNPYGRTITVPVPLWVDRTERGIAQLEISTADELSLPLAEVVNFLEESLGDDGLAKLNALQTREGRVSFAQLRSAGLDVQYDPRNVAVLLAIPGGLRPEKQIAVSPSQTRSIENTISPARTSAYLNIRGTLGYDAAGQNEGFVDPLFDLSGAVRARDVVIESDFALNTSGGGQTLTRSFTRAVYDIPDKDLRLSALDVFPFAASFLPAPNLLGISVERRRQLFNPQTILRSDTSRAFTLQEQSVVEVIVNGTEVRRVQLDPGSYRLTDFPFASGANDVQIIATDNFGRREIANFDQFYNFSFLQKGETELGLSAGFVDQFGVDGGRYDFDRPTVVGFYRKGVSETLTLGGAFQGDKETQNASVEATLGGPLGIFLFEGAVSQDRVLGFGQSGRIQWQLPPQSTTSVFAGIGATLDYTSRDFNTTGRLFRSTNPLIWTAGANVALRFSDEDFLTLNGFYSRFRDGVSSTYEVSGRYNRRIGRDLLVTFAAGYGRNRFNGEDPFFRITLSKRIGRRGFGQASYDSRQERYRAAYNYNDGIGTGAYNINAAIDGSGDDIAGNGGFFYLANNAEVGVTHNSAFNVDQSTLSTARTNLQFGTSLMIADGSFAVGRPVNDAFAVVDTHKTLKGKDVFVDQNQEGDYFAGSNGIGPAAVNDLGSYVDRTLRVAVPEAPIGYDIGSGTYRVFPPYRAGYAIEVGSDFTITVLGTLSSAGRPVSLATGTARLPADPEVKGITLFTNRAGRFGISGLKPGRWVIEMNTTPKTRFEIEIPDNGETLIRLGEVVAE